MSNESTDFDPTAQVARDLELPAQGVAAVLALLADGATVPFIARYRKEATGGLDEVAIRAIRDAAQAARELESRRQTILGTIEGQGKLTAELRRRIDACTTRTALEDLYLPYRPKRRTRATMAREKGLQPLADRILQQVRQGSPHRDARAFVDGAAVGDPEAALAGARDIVAEALADDPEVRGAAREATVRYGRFTARPTKTAKAERTRFEQYYDFEERVQRIPSHRFLALMRGEREGALKVRIEQDVDRLVPRLARLAGHDRRSPWAEQLWLALSDAVKRLLLPSIDKAVRKRIKAAADREAVQVFARNLDDLLMAPPLGPRRVLGVDPGLRTGCKCAVVDATGRFLAYETIHLHRGERGTQALARLVAQHTPFAIAVGNGTGGREALAACRAVAGDAVVVEVNEAGASVYSASDVARAEFPELDLTVRGAISIARRLQDPLAELVKIEPKAIGVGQYQHDLPPALLETSLNEVVSSCVNRVGVDLATASAPLLAQVAGVGPTLAERIVAHRERHGAFADRAALLQVKGLGPRTFEQAAGFLRVHGGHPLDASAVHPERYALVERIARDLGVSLVDLVGDAGLVDRIDLQRYLSADVGLPTLRDILTELARPGRDPRAEFAPPAWRDDVRTLDDLQVGMILEGQVSNVTHFGAFVDLGVHQDGLVHISKLADRFVSDPHQVVRTGQRLQVMVLGVDHARKRIALTARPSDLAG